MIQISSVHRSCHESHLKCRLPQLQIIHAWNWGCPCLKKDPVRRKTWRGPRLWSGSAGRCFFLHPTSYTDLRVMTSGMHLLTMSAPIKDDEGTIHFQASAFNEAGFVYAPRYRQAHLHAYLPKTAYLPDWLLIKNICWYQSGIFCIIWIISIRGRPIIIAAHSQGTTHAIRLLQEFLMVKSYNLNW